MKKYLLLPLLIVCGSCRLQASLMNNRRALELTPSHLAKITEKRGLTLPSSPTDNPQEFTGLADNLERTVKTATDQLFSALFRKDLIGVRKALKRGADPSAGYIYHYSYSPLLVLWVTPTMLAAKFTSPDSVEILKALVAAGADSSAYATTALERYATEIDALLIAEESNNTDARDYLLTLK